MASVDLQRTLSVPSVPARAALSSILHEIAEERGDWEEFSLYLNFGSLGLPDVGYIAIPVHLEGLREETEPRHAIHFTMQARRLPEAFPVFRGAIGIDATGPSNATLWLAGDYEVPLHGFGNLVNTAVLQGTAAKALENMLTELADAVSARVEKREMASARYRLVFNTGD
jgi:hypothetical protein